MGPRRSAAKSKSSTWAWPSSTTTTRAERCPTAGAIASRQPGATMGTVDYMAPEQWENSASADIPPTSTVSAARFSSS